MSKLLTKHLELVSTSKDGVRRLRQLILDLAVQGKLVPQDPNDEPAKDWLAGLQKVASIGEIDLNTSLPLPKPPDGWMWCFLQEISNINMGQSPDGKSYNVSGEGTPLINGPVEFSKSPYGTTIKSKWTTEPNKI